MKYRKLDAAGDYSFGSGTSDFWANVPDAPAQAVRTRLSLWEGDWFLDRREGMPWRTKVLGKYTESTRDPVIRSHVLGTRGVKSILEYSSDLNRDARKFAGDVKIDTVYGAASISEPK